MKLRSNTLLLFKIALNENNITLPLNNIITNKLLMRKSSFGTFVFRNFNHRRHRPIHHVNIASYSQTGTHNHRCSKCSLFLTNGTSSSTKTQRTFSSFQDTRQDKRIGENHDITPLMARTQDLLYNIPIGSFRISHLHESERLMEDWVQLSSIQGVQEATKILSRIIDENAVGNPQVFFHIRMIDLILHHWVQISPIQFPHQASSIIHKLETIFDSNAMPYKTFLGALIKCRNLKAIKASDSLLNRMIYLYEKGDITRSPPDTITFNSVISAWMNHTTQSSYTYVSAGQEACKILNKMKGLYRLGNHDVKPNFRSFCMTITALVNDATLNISNENQSKSDLLLAEEVLHDMIYFYTHDHHGDNNELKPDVGIFHAILGALSKCAGDHNITHSGNEIQDGVYENKSDDSFSRALRLLETMEHLDIPIDTKTYNTIIAVVLRSVHLKEKAVSIISNLIQDMQRKGVKADKITYNSLLKAYCNDGDASGAESILKQMLKLYQEDNIQLKPDNTSWNTVIEAHANRKEKNAADNASRILHGMQSFHEAGNNDVCPDKVSISLIINALLNSARRGNKNAGHRARQILERMEYLYQNGNTRMQPDAITYTSVIACIAQSGHEDAASAALNILKKMQTKYREGNQDAKPDITTYNAVLSAIASSRAKNAALNAQNLLFQIAKDKNVQPNTVSYSIVISAWAKSQDKNAANMAEQLLKYMENEYKIGNKNISPNTICYSSVINALSKSGAPDATERSIKILQRMEELSDAGNYEIAPNAFTYSSVMEAISKSPEKDKIAGYVSQLISQIVAKSRQLDRSIDGTILHGDDTTTSTSMMNPNRHRQKTTNANESICSTIFFNTAIKAIEKSSEVNKAHKAKTILGLMKQLSNPHPNNNTQLGNTVSTSTKMNDKKNNLQPNIRTYNSIIRCCAFTQGNDKIKEYAFMTAMEMLNELRSCKTIEPDLYTYPAMFKVCEKLLSTPSTASNEPIIEQKGINNSSVKKIKDIFQKCCDDGMLDALVLNNLGNFLPHDIFQTIVMEIVPPVNNGTSTASVDDDDLKYNAKQSIHIRSLPESWSRKSRSIAKR